MNLCESVMQHLCFWHAQKRQFRPNIFEKVDKKEIENDEIIYTRRSRIQDYSPGNHPWAQPRPAQFVLNLPKIHETSGFVFF